MELTQEQLAKRLGISRKYLSLIEKSRQKPKYPLLFRIIRELNIDPDLIFYPEKSSKDSRIEDLVRMLYRCDDYSLSIIKATAKAVTEVKV
jgi:transcriptional regulator with XRE-family HTH domain